MELPQPLRPCGADRARRLSARATVGRWTAIEKLGSLDGWTFSRRRSAVAHATQHVSVARAAAPNKATAGCECRRGCRRSPGPGEAHEVIRAMPVIAGS